MISRDVAMQFVWLPVDRITERPCMHHSNAWVAHYRELLELHPDRHTGPIEVAPLPDGTYLLLNGHHRLAANRETGRTEIAAWIVEDTD